MTQVRVKICGLTRYEDALMAANAGADYLGFILYPPSPRAISPDHLARLTSALRRDWLETHRKDRRRFPVLVGVFVNESASRIAELLDRCALDLAQLSGDENPELVRNPDSPLFNRAYKALRPRSIPEARELASEFAAQPTDKTPQMPCLLLDTPHGALYGGTGQTGDWQLAAELSAMTKGLMLAGGLSPENVAEAVRRVRPFAVDVAGGVESAPGYKNHDLIRAFITNAKTVELSHNENSPF